MIVLGLKVFGHDTGAALIEDTDEDVKITAISEERLNRRKHTSRFPIFSIDYCLKNHNISLEDVDCIVFNERKKSNNINDFFDFSYAYEYKKYDATVGKKFKWDKNKVNIINHHDAHAASAFFASSYDDATILVVDSSGNMGESQSIYSANGNEIKLLDRSLSRGIGKLYDLATYQILGFKPAGDAGKTMGLSAYGADEKKLEYSFSGYYQGIDTNYSKIIEEKNETIKLKCNIEKCKCEEDLLSYPYNKLAYEVQKETERAMLHLIEYAWEIAPSTNLCIAGGVGLNCIANDLIRRKGKFENIFIQPAADDSGIPLGAALYGYNCILKKENNFNMNTASLGKTYSKDSYIQMFKENGINYKFKTIREIAEDLSQGKIYGWFSGGSEYGPRALGNRSILCDPRNIENRNKINMKIKHREVYRPFAPIVLEHHAQEYFDIDIPSPFMLYAPKVKDKCVELAPAVVHRDNTARLQTVNKENNLLMYKLLSEFENITGVPILINTSFNDREPIVETPIDAIICMLSTNLDGCYFEGVFVSKNDNNKETLKRLIEKRKKFLYEKKNILKEKYCYS